MVFDSLIPLGNSYRNVKIWFLKKGIMEDISYELRVYESVGDKYIWGHISKFDRKNYFGQ